MKGHDRTTVISCSGAEGNVDNTADWYFAEARLDGMRRIMAHRLKILEKTDL